MESGSLNTIIIPKRYSLAGIFFISLSVLMFELALMRYLSVILFPSIAFFGITLAMFGLTLGGIFVYLFPNFFISKKQNVALYSSTIIMGLSQVYFAYIIPSYNPGAGMTGLIGMFALVTLPFFASSIFLTIVFMRSSKFMGRLYAFDLAGAGMGVILSIVAVSYFNINQVMIISALMTFLGQALFFKNTKPIFYLAVILAISASGFFLYRRNSVEPDLRYNKFGPETNVVFSKWNSFSRISLQNEATARTIVSLSPKFGNMNYQERQMGISIDADAYTPVLEYNGKPDSVIFLTHDLSAAAYKITKPGRALIIGPGGGRDVLIGFLHDYQIKGVDVNPIVVNDLMKDRLKEFSGNLYNQPGIDVVVNEGRSFVQRDQTKYEVISLPLVDTWASTIAGNLSLVEGYLYTVEAFQDYLGHLSHGGVLTISRWFIDGDRLVSLFTAAARQMGIRDPESHVIVMSRYYENRGPWLNNYLFSAAPFTQDQISQTDNFARENGFVVTYTPGKNDHLGGIYGKIIDAVKNNKLIANTQYNMAPVYDNNPFFFMHTPIKKLFAKSRFTDFGKLPDGGLGMTLLAALIFAAICLLLPLIFSIRQLWAPRRITKTLKHLVYFGLLGISFMLIEIALIQKFILYLEYPTYSYSVVLTVALMFAGMGSLFSERLNASSKANFYKIAFGIAGYLLFSFLATNIIFKHTLGWPIAFKIATTVVLNAPVALMMGMMLPLGFARLEIEDMKKLLPWCWAFNGALSILGSVGAVIIAMVLGFSTVLFLGAGGYVLAGMIYTLNLKTNKGY